MAKLKFEFGIDFQELILQYTVTDKLGYKALELYEDTYFTVIHQAIIAYGLKKYYKKKKKIPEETILRETLRVLYSSDRKDFSNLKAEDKDKIDKLVTKLYNKPVGDSTEVLDKIINFARYVKFKEVMENVDINRYDSYEQSITQLTAANRVGTQIQEDYGVFVVSGMPDRAHKRDLLNECYATPFWQMNKLLNSGGTFLGNIILIVAEAKRFKTGALLNISKFLMRRKRKIIYFDFENGQNALVTREEQSLTGSDQEEILSGAIDEKLLKLMRKYKRIGAEFVIKRMVAYRDTTLDCQALVDKIKLDKGIVFDDCIFDFPDVMAATSGKTEEVQRISDVYIDIKNFAEFNKMKSTWVASHVVRGAAKRRGTKYIQDDLAKCSDKIRHCDVAFGLQESDDEREAGVIRFEVIEQRNGGYGNMLFWVDIAKQQMKEFTKKQAKDYRKQLDESSRVEKTSDL